MRIKVGRAVKLNPGDEARVTVRLPSNADLCRTFVWSAQGDDDLSPHIPIARINAASSEPVMHKVRSTFVNKEIRKASIVVPADANMTLQMMQEKDVASDPSAVIRISVRSRRWIAFWLKVRSFFNLAGARRQTGQGFNNV